MVNSTSVRTTHKKLISGSGKLAELTFVACDLDLPDTCCSEIEISSWNFEEGCYRPVLHAGEICVVPVSPLVQCGASIPQVLAWDNIAKGYVPDRCTVTMQVKNLGEGDAKNARFRILFDAQDFALAGPVSAVQYGAPSSVQSNGGCLSVTWSLAPQCRSLGREAEVCIVASFDNHPDVRCCSRIWIPAANISTAISAGGPTQLCDGGSVVLSAEPGCFAYRWNTGDTSPSITVSQSGEYFCVVQSAGGCVFATDTITVVRRDAIDPRIKALGYTPICEGDSVELDAGAGYVSYLWNTGAKTRTITAKVQGLYMCYVEDSSLCGATTPAFLLDVEKLPVPVLMRNGNTLSTSVSAVRYEWTLDGTVLPGETNASLAVTQTGSYVVTAYSAGGCKGVSVPFVVDVVMSVAGMPASAFTMDVYPEPNNGFFTVAIRLETPADLDICVCDVLGRTVCEYHEPASSCHVTRGIGLDAMPSGMYMLRVSAAGHTQSRSVIKKLN
jgi:hypothetical protein